MKVTSYILHISQVKEKISFIRERLKLRWLSFICIFLVITVIWIGTRNEYNNYKETLLCLHWNVMGKKYQTLSKSTDKIISYVNVDKKWARGRVITIWVWISPEFRSFERFAFVQLLLHSSRNCKLFSVV